MRHGDRWRMTTIVGVAALVAVLGSCTDGAPTPATTPLTSAGATTPLTSTGATTRSGTTSTPKRSVPPASSSSSSPRSYPASAFFSRCGPPGAPSTSWRVRVSAGNTITGISTGAGSTTVVFVHEFGGQGLCGFESYAAWLAGRGVRSVLIDLCGNGSSVCRSSYGPELVAQTLVAVRWARAHGAHRLLLVGASMGGTVAMAAAGRAHADAVVDLSGPMTWDPVTPTARAAAALRIPALAVCTPGDPDTSYADLRRAAATVRNRRARFVTAPGGHGWGTLEDYYSSTTVISPIGRLVARWIRGQHA